MSKKARNSVLHQHKILTHRTRNEPESDEDIEAKLEEMNELFVNHRHNKK